MKRRGQLRRKAPLTRRPPTRSKHTPSKLRPTRRPQHDGLFWETQRLVIGGRAGYRCERCGTNLNRTGMQAHHRKLRSQGGRHGVENLLALCPDCHRWVHAHPEEAISAGWIVPSIADPVSRAVLLHDGRTVRLTPEGTYDVCWDDREEQAG